MPRQIQFREARFFVEDTNAAFWNSMESGKWESTTFDVFDAHLDKETCFLDVGSWIGPTALYAANRVKRVICIEADPVAANQLRRNILLNPELAAKIEVVEKAIAPASGKVNLGAKTGRGDSMSSVLFAGGGDTWEVQSITPSELAGFCDARSKKVFVKMDIEGGEYSLLPYMAPLASLRNVKFLIAFHPKFLPFKSPLLWLKAAQLSRRGLAAFKDYTVTRVKKRQIRSMPIVTMLNRLGVAYYPARHSLLLLRTAV